MYVTNEFRYISKASLYMWKRNILNCVKYGVVVMALLCVLTIFLLCDWLIYDSHVYISKIFYQPVHRISYGVSFLPVVGDVETVVY